MPANVHLLSGLGDGGAFIPAQGCPVAGAWAAGAYMSHQGDEDDFLVADAATRAGGASARIVVWRCVFCGTLVAGIGRADGDPGEDDEFFWVEERVPEIGRQ